MVNGFHPSTLLLEIIYALKTPCQVKYFAESRANIPKIFYSGLTSGIYLIVKFL